MYAIVEIAGQQFKVEEGQKLYVHRLDAERGSVLDFDKVDSISSSFADELVAKIMVEVGQEKFINHVKIKNTNDFIKTMINTSVAARLQLKNKG